MPEPPYGGFGPIFALNGVTPVIAADAFLVHPLRQSIGDVTTLRSELADLVSLQHACAAI